LALQLVQVQFKGNTPSLRAIVIEAERIGGLAIVTTEIQERALVVAFASFPKGRVTIRVLGNARIDIADLSLVAPALYRLLWQALIHLGATPACSEPPLALPLTEEDVRNYNRKYQRVGAIASFLLLALLAIIITLVAGGVWSMWLRAMG
jgi:hypothetical protein